MLGQKTMINKEFPGVLSVLLEPFTRTAEAETVAPCVHVLHETFSPDSADAIRKHDLQVTNAGLLEIVTPRVTVEPLPAIRCHANDVATFVQQRMYGRVASYINRLAHNSCFRVAPEAARDWLVVILDKQSEVVLAEQ